MSGEFQRGSSHRGAKMDEDKVIEARAKAAADPTPGIVKRLAAEYGVSRPQMSSILVGADWSHVPGALEPGFTTKNPKGRQPRVLRPRLEPCEDLPGEEWRPVVGREGTHEVSNYARLRSLPRIINANDPRSGGIQRRVSGGLMNPTLARPKKGPPTWRVGFAASQTRLLSTVVAEAFLGPPPSRNAQAVHKDGDTLNCRPENLEYLDSQQIADLQDQRGTRPRGEAQGTAKLKEEQVIWLRELVARGTYTQRQIAKELRMSECQISRIVNGHQWKHVLGGALVRGRTRRNPPVTAEERAVREATDRELRGLRDYLHGSHAAPALSGETRAKIAERPDCLKESQG